MAIYHFSGTVISRSQGRSSVAASAYRSGACLTDERQEKVHDYNQKQDVAYTDILLPEGAPQWMSDREKLWNTVEKIEKRKDAQLAREFTISLPRELSIEQNITLARDFVQQAFVNRGMVADLCIHNDLMKDGERQPHAHVMLTMREITVQGFGQKVREWNQKENIMLWREDWANTANCHLALHGFDIQIDHRSFEAQGIELEPQYKIGASIARDKHARLVDHQRIAYENGMRIYENPILALDALTRQQSTFTPHDLARFINRHTETSEQFQQVYQKVSACEALVSLGVDTKGQERFTTQEMLTIESRLLKNANSLSDCMAHGVTQNALAHAIENRTLTDEQQLALRYITDPGDLKCVIGFAGTGKSYVLGAAREAWEASGYRVRGAALSGIAAQNLTQSSGIQSRTVASFLYRFDNDYDTLSARDILVIDEAGMLGSRQMERLISEAHTAGAKVVAIGDPQQLQAIEAGAAFRALIESHQYVELTDIKRQQVAWQREATLSLAKGDIETALNSYRRHDLVHEFKTQGEAKARLIDQWNDVRLNHPQQSQIILAYTRKDMQELNEMARSLKRQGGELGEDYLLETARGERQFAAGDRVYFLQREDKLGVVNGTLGTIREINDKTGIFNIELDDVKQRHVEVNTQNYIHLEHGYAATVYKAQGVTVDRAYMLTSRHFDAHSTYVGMSRHRQSCDIFISKEAFPQDSILINNLSRDRTKDVTLDYTKLDKEFARQRAIQLVVNTLEQSPSMHQDIAAIIRPQKAITQELRPERERFLKTSKQFMEDFRKENPELAEELEHEMQGEKPAAKLIKDVAEHDRTVNNPLPKEIPKEVTKHITKELELDL